LVDDPRSPIEVTLCQLAANGGWLKISVRRSR
jgi:hypothetical protein